MLASWRLYTGGLSVDLGAYCHFAAMSWWAYTPSGFADQAVANAVGFSSTDRRTFSDLPGLQYVRAVDAHGQQVAIAGTSTIGQWLDYVIQAGFVNAGGLTGQVFGPFDRWSDIIAADLQARAPLNLPMVLCGHSLGGALSVLVAEKLRRRGYFIPVVHTVGCPRVGDANFIGDVQTRVHNYLGFLDVVPLLPPPLATTGRLVDSLGVVVPNSFRPPFDWQEWGLDERGFDPFAFFAAYNLTRSAFTLAKAQLNAHSISNYLTKRWQIRNLGLRDFEALVPWKYVATALWGINPSNFS